MMKMLIEVT